MLDTHGIVEEVEIVEVHSYYLLFREVALKLYSYNPLDRFLQ